MRELLCSGAIRRHQLGAKDLLTPTSYHDISNVTAIFSGNDKGSDPFERVVSSNYVSVNKSSPQYYYGGYADYYYSYGDSDYDPKVGKEYYIANSEYPVNIGDK